MNKNKTFLESLLNALNGIKFAILSEKNMRFHLFFSVIILFFSFYFKLSVIEWSIVLFLIFLVIICELLNTILEKIMDFLSIEYDARIKNIKDMAAAVVLMVSVLAVIVGCMIFIPKIF